LFVACSSFLATIAGSWLLAGTSQAVAPTNNTPPTITGAATAQERQPLTEVHGTWTPMPASYSLQWEQCDNNGVSCNPILNAAGPTYTPTPGDVGHKIVVQEIASDGLGGTSIPASSAATAVVAQAPPLNLSAPAISGLTWAGQTLTVAQGSWSDSPTDVTDSWERCDSTGAGCGAIPGATGQSYTLTAADAGHAIVVQETAKNSAGPTAAPASSAPSAPVTVPSTTGLLVLPTAAVANEPVTLIATVTSSVTGAPPSGTLTFKSDGRTIGACANEPVRPSAQSVTVTCKVSFSASTAQLAAAFAPGAGSNVTPSSSAGQSITVGRDSTSTSLDASKAANVGASTTYTATVTPPADRAGPLQPTGSVEFFDGAAPIAPCTSRPLILGGATCRVTYSAPGVHAITARYSGDVNFTESVSPSDRVTVARPPANVLGSITSTMQWVFRFTRTYTTVTALVVNGAVNANVLVKCQGAGCPFKRHTTLVTGSRHCGLKATRTCLTHGTLDLTPQFRGRRLPIGTKITVMIVRPGWVGKYYMFTVRGGQSPRIRLSCLAPGGSRPGVHC
jgi:hypothetical protein